MSLVRGYRKARKPPLMLAMNRARRSGRKPKYRKNPGWVLWWDDYNLPPRPWEQRSLEDYERHHQEKAPTLVKEIPYGYLRNVLAYQSHELTGTESFAQSMQASQYVAVPFFWGGMRHLVLPRSDLIRDLLESDIGEVEMDEMVEAWITSGAVPGRQLLFPFDLEGYLYLTPDGSGIIEGIYCWALARTNIDCHPDLQMVMHTLLNALRWEGVILPNTQLTWGTYTGRPVEELFWDHFHTGTWEEFGTDLQLSEIALWAEKPDDIPLEDRRAIEEYEWEYAEWMELFLLPAGEFLEITAAGPYSAPVDYCPVPGMPGYMPQAMPGAPRPKVLPSSGESMTLFGGEEELKPAPVPVHPEVLHGPPAFQPYEDPQQKLLAMEATSSPWDPLTVEERSARRRRAPGAPKFNQRLLDAQNGMIYGRVDDRRFHAALRELPTANLLWVMDRVDRMKYEIIKEEVERRWERERRA